MHGYDVTTYEDAACAAESSFAKPLSVNCSKRFPWISGSMQQSQAILGTNGVDFSYSATVRGHYSVPSGTTAHPLEVRELVLRLRGAEEANTNPIIQAGSKCGRAIEGLPFSAFRETARSFADDSDIPAILAVVDDKIIWLEFDEKGWPEGEYLRVLKLAASDAESL